MSIAALIRQMAAAGAPAEAIAIAVEAVEGAQAEVESRKASARDRKARQRERERDSHGTVTGQSDECHATPASPSSLPPRPPNLTTPTPPVVTTRTRQADAFEVFWEAYPRKTAKHVAEKAFPKAIASIDAPDPLAVMLAGIARDREGRQWRQGVIPHASTWLNQKRWQDEPETGNPDERHSNSPRQVDRDQRLSRMLAGAMEAVDRT